MQREVQVLVPLHMLEMNSQDSNRQDDLSVSGCAAWCRGYLPRACSVSGITSNVDSTVTELTVRYPEWEVKMLHFLDLKLRQDIAWVNWIFRQDKRFITFATNEHRWTLFTERLLLNFNGALLQKHICRMDLSIFIIPLSLPSVRWLRNLVFKYSYHVYEYFKCVCLQ